MEIKGVTEVVSFDEQTVILNTVCGGLAVDGMSLHIQVLNLEQGIVTVDGRIDNLSYYETEHNEKTSKGGFFGKLFR
ncbi:MAG: sporulation protein YabP [Clostridia bacterium]|nr:sporulation protein YabP [Clostridia bacterium]